MWYIYTPLIIFIYPTNKLTYIPYNIYKPTYITWITPPWSLIPINRYCSCNPIHYRIQNPVLPIKSLSYHPHHQPQPVHQVPWAHGGDFWRGLLLRRLQQLVERPKAPKAKSGSGRAVFVSLEFWIPNIFSACIYICYECMCVYIYTHTRTHTHLSLSLSICVHFYIPLQPRNLLYNPTMMGSWRRKDAKSGSFVAICGDTSWS